MTLTKLESRFTHKLRNFIIFTHHSLERKYTTIMTSLLFISPHFPYNNDKANVVNTYIHITSVSHCKVCACVRIDKARGLSPVQTHTIYNIFYCSSMHFLYVVHCEIIDVNIGILIKGAILNLHHMTLSSTFIINDAHEVIELAKQKVTNQYRDKIIKINLNIFGRHNKQTQVWK